MLIDLSSYRKPARFNDDLVRRCGHKMASKSLHTMLCYMQNGGAACLLYLYLESSHTLDISLPDSKLGLIPHATFDCIPQFIDIRQTMTQFDWQNDISKTLSRSIASSTADGNSGKWI